MCRSLCVEDGAVDASGIAVQIRIHSGEYSEVLGRFVGIGRRNLSVAKSILEQPTRLLEEQYIVDTNQGDAMIAAERRAAVICTDVLRVLRTARRERCGERCRRRVIHGLAPGP